MAELQVRHVLVPLDGSEFALRALPTARVLAERLGAELQTISVAEGDEVDRLRNLASAAIGVRVGDGEDPCGHWRRPRGCDRPARGRTGLVCRVYVDAWAWPAGWRARGIGREVCLPALLRTDACVGPHGGQPRLDAPSSKLARAPLRTEDRRLRRRVGHVRTGAPYSGFVGFGARDVDDDPDRCGRRATADSRIGGRQPIRIARRT